MGPRSEDTWQSGSKSSAMSISVRSHSPVIGHYDEQSVPEPPVSRKSGRATRKPTRSIEEC